MKTLWTIIKTAVIVMLASCAGAWLLVCGDENFRRGFIEAFDD